MSLEIDGVWKADVWAPTIWADGVWFEKTIVTTKGGMSLTEKEYYKLERKQIEEQQKLKMLSLDDDEIITLLM
jgi:hypothetical protein